MQLTSVKEDPMRAEALLAPAVAVEKRYLELDEEELIASFEITQEEILDDLLYPADHRAAQSTALPATAEERLD
jgi:hypothetical protein